MPGGTEGRTGTGTGDFLWRWTSLVLSEVLAHGRGQRKLIRLGTLTPCVRSCHRPATMKLSGDCPHGQNGPWAAGRPARPSEDAHGSRALSGGRGGAGQQQRDEINQANKRRPRRGRGHGLGRGHSRPRSPRSAQLSPGWPGQARIWSQGQGRPQHVPGPRGQGVGRPKVEAGKHLQARPGGQSSGQAPPGKGPCRVGSRDSVCVCRAPLAAIGHRGGVRRR